MLIMSPFTFAGMPSVPPVAPQQVVAPPKSGSKRRAPASARPPTFEIGARHAFITVMSYNVQGLPRIAGPTQDRYAEIGNQMKQLRSQSQLPSISFLQESFVARTKEIRNRSGYQFFASGPNATDVDGFGNRVRKILNGGLWAMSDFPIVRSAKVAYANMDCNSWDCFAAKGAQAVRVKVEGIPFELSFINTHVQAGGTYVDAREKQFRMLWDFTNKFVPSQEPVIIVGDFNTFATRKCYDFWMTSARLESVNDRCIKDELDSGCRMAIRQGHGMDMNPDHQFYRNGQINGHQVTIEPVYAEHIFNEPVGGRLLSDHWAYNVTYKINW